MAERRRSARCRRQPARTPNASKPVSFHSRVRRSGGEIGKRKGLKIPRGRPLAGSIPAPSTAHFHPAKQRLLSRIAAQIQGDALGELAAARIFIHVTLASLGETSHLGP